MDYTWGLRATLILGFMIFATVSSAQSATTIRLTLNGNRFQPAEVIAPANRPITIIVKNAGSTAAEFESNTLRVEKVMTPGATITLQVRPLAPGRYRFFNDFHQETDGYIVVK